MEKENLHEIEKDNYYFKVEKGDSLIKMSIKIFEGKGMTKEFSKFITTEDPIAAILFDHFEIFKNENNLVFNIKERKMSIKIKIG